MAGSAWTNQVVSQVLIAGTVPGVLAYNPSIGAGNLIASVSGQQTVDSPLNDVVLAGITRYSKAAGPSVLATELGSGTTGGLVVLKAATEAGPYGQVSALAMDTGGNATLEANANIVLIAGQGGSGGQLQAQTPGVSGFLPVMQVDISTHAVGNTGTLGDITRTWTISAGDGNTGTTYTIKALAQMVTGATTAESLTIGIDADGVQTPLATLGAAFNGSALSTSYDIPLELVVIVDGAGAGNPQVYLSGPLGDISSNRLATNSANMSGHSNVLAWSGAASHTLAVYAQWGGAGGTGQNIQTITSRLYREGP